MGNILFHPLFKFVQECCGSQMFFYPTSRHHKANSSSYSSLNPSVARDSFFLLELFIGAVLECGLILNPSSKSCSQKKQNKKKTCLGYQKSRIRMCRKKIVQMGSNPQPLGMSLPSHGLARDCMKNGACLSPNGKTLYRKFCPSSKNEARWLADSSRPK